MDSEEIDLVWPLRNWRVSRGFKGKHGRQRAHQGVDLAAPKGTEILSSIGGVVLYAGKDFAGFGKLIIVENGRWATFYSHCSRIFVQEGEDVVPGQVIGAVGSTGRSTGPHLHFELRLDRTAMDPMPYLEHAPVVPHYAGANASTNRGVASESQRQ